MVFLQRPGTAGLRGEGVVQTHVNSRSPASAGEERADPSQGIAEQVAPGGLDIFEDESR